MMRKPEARKLLKVGQQQEDFAIEAKPILVEIRRTKRDRVVDAIVLVAIAVAANVIVSYLM